MKFILTAFLLFILPNIAFGQADRCDAVVYWKYDGFIKIYDEPNGKEIKSIQNDLKNENFAWFRIKDLKDNFFHVEISLEMENTSYTGWVERSNYIGTFMKHEKESMDLTLCSKPNDKFSETIEIKNWKAGFVTIKECVTEWTKVSVEVDGKQITGWIESKKLCANNYSSCN